jgi:hypothetical protein
MVPAEIEPADQRPMLRNREGLDRDIGDGKGEDPPRAQLRHSLRPGLALMRGIARNDARALVRPDMPGIVDRHPRHRAIGGRLGEEAPHHLRHAEERREGHEDDP